MYNDNDNEQNEISEEIALDFFFNGEIDKAVKVFEALILVYPEKKEHWQSQIDLLVNPISDEEKNSYRDDLKKWKSDEE